MALNWVLNSLTYVQQDDVCPVCAATGWEAMWGTEGRVPMVSQRKTRQRSGERRKKKNELPYLQISRDVSSCQDARGRGEENGEHAKEAALRSPPAGHEIGSENIRCQRWNIQFNCRSIAVSKQFISITIPHKHSVHSLHNSFHSRNSVTFVAEKPSGLFLRWSRNERSYKVTGEWHHDDQEEQDLCLDTSNGEQLIRLLSWRSSHHMFCARKTLAAIY